MDKTLAALVDELNRIRLDENISYAELGAQIGIDGGALYKILNGRSDPYDRTLHKIQRFLEERAEKSGGRRKAAAAR
ncbi:MAG TPA: helix-turn-helix transcriptional regulator [Vicinamibacterales bacterium]|nr:helix-turn-helix transcriptional regulator [Vicinamibacterales bacterium]